MSQDNLYGTEARERLMKGIRKVSQAVGRTMGTSGGNVLLEAIERPNFLTTNDGFSIANSIVLTDPLEELGRKILVEAINRANKSSGDGSSTCCVLTATILEEGIKHIGEVSPMEIKRSLEECIPLIEKSIKEQTKTITVDEVKAVASISAEDESIGSLIQEIYQKIGKDGVVSWDVSKTAEDYYTIGTGLTIHGATYASPYMCDIDESGSLSTSVRWKNPKILLCKQKITLAADFNDLFQSLFTKDIREVAIFCDEIEVPVIADLIRTRAIRGFKTVVIKMPVLWADEWWEDLALASGATVINSVSGLSLSKAKEEHLGTVEHLTVTKEATYIDGIKDLKKHILALQVENTEQSLLRASRLNTRTARYFVGAHSESALSYRRLKVEDAIGAAACALENGVVVGGGIALLNTSKDLPDTIGGKILQKALQNPFNRIVENTGHKKIDIVGTGPNGFNSKTGKVEDLVKAGVIDPADVVLNAVKSAIGVAASILTIGTVVLLPKDEAVPMQLPR